MGQQIRFYMTEDDEDAFVAFARSTGDIVIFAQVSAESEGETFSSFRDLSNRRLGEACHLWNRSISPTPLWDFFSAHGGCYCLDFMQSEVVNVMRSKLAAQKLSMGRLQIEDKILDASGAIVSKSPSHLQWYNSLCKWIRKSYPKKYDGAFISPRAEQVAQTGVTLVGH